MEIINMYAFFDKKSELYDTPFFALDDMHAKRHFHMTAMRKDTMLNTFLTEFEMYSLGKFNKGTGQIELFDKKLILSGNQLANEIRTRDQEQMELGDS